jgi:NAD(P)H-quinone oxidoreductase subunit 5
MGADTSSMVGQDVLKALLVALGPLLLLCFALIPRGWANRDASRMALLATGATLVTLGLALAGAVAVALNGRIEHVFAQAGMAQIGVYFDALSATIFGLVAFLGAIVTRYALNYLKGDAEQGRFLKWLCVTIGAVLTLIVAGNLLLLTLAWVATSLSLNKLLTFYGDRPSALIAARKKFVISRLGDACMVGALVLAARAFESWQFSEMFARAGQMRESGVVPGEVGAMGLLLVAGAMLKSAQFPFHSWLPDTMETPTPVSALMHAGIINAGGFLLVRLSPIVSLSPTALNILALVGAFTALFASLVMMTQASVKRMLAFSTIAQMGFMMLQCGLGAFSVAVLHIVAHSLYKAHAFLSSGSVVAISKGSWVPTGRPSAHPGVLAAALAGAVAVVGASALAFGVSPSKEPGALVLGAVLVMALTHLLWSAWGQSQGATLSPRLAASGLAMAAAVSVAYFALHIGFKYLLASSVAQAEPVRGVEGALLVLVVALFGAVLVFQEQLPTWASRPWCHALYVHARNGFYFNTLANRAVQALWPARAR